MCRGSLQQDVETCQSGQIGHDKGASIYLRSPAQRVSVRALRLAQKCLEEQIRRLPVSQLFEVRPASAPRAPAGFFFNPYPYLKKAGAGECLASASWQWPALNCIPAILSRNGFICAHRGGLVLRNETH